MDKSWWWFWLGGWVDPTHTWSQVLERHVWKGFPFFEVECVDLQVHTQQKQLVVQPCEKEMNRIRKSGFWFYPVFWRGIFATWCTIFGKSKRLLVPFDGLTHASALLNSFNQFRSYTSDTLASRSNTAITLNQDYTNIYFQMSKCSSTN